MMAARPMTDSRLRIAPVSRKQFGLDFIGHLSLQYLGRPNPGKDDRNQREQIEAEHRVYGHQHRAGNGLLAAVRPPGSEYQDRANNEQYRDDEPDDNDHHCESKRDVDEVVGMFIYIFIYIVCGDRRILNAKGILERYGLITEQIVDAAKLDNITRVTSKYSCSMTGSSPYAG